MPNGPLLPSYQGRVIRCDFVPSTMVRAKQRCNDAKGASSTRSEVPARHSRTRALPHKIYTGARTSHTRALPPPSSAAAAVHTRWGLCSWWLWGGHGGGDQQQSTSRLPAAQPERGPVKTFYITARVSCAVATPSLANTRPPYPPSPCRAVLAACGSPRWFQLPLTRTA